jgi:tight adherence protein C
MQSLSSLAILLTFLSAAGLLLSFVQPRRSGATGERVLRAIRGDIQNKVQGAQEARAWASVKLIATWCLSRAGAVIQDGALRDRLRRAGLTGARQMDAYISARLLGPVLGLTIGSLIPSHRMLCMVAFAGTAYLLPTTALSWMIKKRREKIRRSIPEAIDLLVICVDAGLGMDQAILRVGQELSVSHPEITSEFVHINREQRAGKARLQAWRDMAGRIDLPEMDAFVNMLAQTERFGTPISKALSNYSNDIRLKRRQKAEELAAKTTVKIIFPLVLFIFPSMFVVLLGPAGLNVVRGLR